ncbi:MAG: aspartate kinase [Bdellovibrionota bacterium]
MLVQKYGGATLSSPEKIKAVAQKISQLSKSGQKLIVVVSAMGKTTNSLIELANAVSPQPDPREMDMLLSVGERISMALMSIALNDLGCPAISFTGSQAGIFTNDSHVNAMIIDVKAYRAAEALDHKKVVILAGFQGVSPTTKEITTLGRGGSDTTAVAMAAAFKAERCEVLKDVSSVFTADPNLIDKAQAIKKLNYYQMLEMTYWGTKVLHYRSVELARSKKVNLYIGPAHSLEEGTMITEKSGNEFESSKALAISTHSWALALRVQGENLTDAWETLQSEFAQNKITFGQFLHSRKGSQGFDFFVTGPEEFLKSIRENEMHFKKMLVDKNEIAVVSLTCTGTSNPQIYNSVLQTLKADKIFPEEVLTSSMSVVVLLPKKMKDMAVRSLHRLIES